MAWTHSCTMKCNPMWLTNYSHEWCYSINHQLWTVWALWSQQLLPKALDSPWQAVLLKIWTLWNMHLHLSTHEPEDHSQLQATVNLAFHKLNRTLFCKIWSIVPSFPIRSWLNLLDIYSSVLPTAITTWEPTEKHRSYKLNCIHTGGLVQSVRTISVWTVLGVWLPHGEY